MDLPLELGVTFRGVDVREETVYFARRCGARLRRRSPGSDERIEVFLERAAGSSVVKAIVVWSAGGDLLVAHGEDPDELLALSNSFASLEGRASEVTALTELH